MNIFRKLASGEWTVECKTPVKAGDVVSVSLSNGSVKQVTLGSMVMSKLSGESYWLVAPPAPKATETVGDLSGILTLFQKAKTHLKYPSVTLQLKDGVSIRINIAGDQAKVPGSLTIMSYDRNPETGERLWFGRVHLDGKYEPSQKAPASVGDILRQFAANPVKVATDHGRLTGRCCFCNLALKDERSTAVGYGQTCANHFGLVWGARPFEFAGAA